MWVYCEVTFCVADISSGVNKFEERLVMNFVFIFFRADECAIRSVRGSLFDNHV